MKRPLKSGESTLSCSKMVKRLSKLKLSKHSSNKSIKKKHLHYLNAPHNTSSFLINEFNKNKSLSDEDTDIPQGSMKDLMNSSADFFKASFSSFDDFTFLCLWWNCDVYQKERKVKMKKELLSTQCEEIYYHIMEKKKYFALW